MSATQITTERIARIIRKEREARRMTLDAVATRVGVRHPTFSAWEMARRPVPLDRVDAIAAALIPDTEEGFEQNRQDFARLIDPKAA